MTVTQRGLIPILIPASNPKEAEGIAFLDGKPVCGRLLPDRILEVFEVEHARQVFEKRYGRLANSQWAGIKAAMALISLGCLRLFHGTKAGLRGNVAE